MWKDTSITNPFISIFLRSACSRKMALRHTVSGTISGAHSFNRARVNQGRALSDVAQDSYVVARTASQHEKMPYPMAMSDFVFGGVKSDANRVKQAAGD